MARVEREFKDGISPIAEANRRDALLLQFPWSFKDSQENRDYFIRLHRALGMPFGS